MSETGAIHAGCVILDEAGVLITGRSGAGKSALARALVAAAKREGRFAALVADDRVLLAELGGRLVARPHPLIAGRMEVRGLGIVSAPFEPAVVVRLVVDLADDPPPRLPEPDLARLRGKKLPLIRLHSAKSAEENAALVRIHLQGATVF